MRIQDAFIFFKQRQQRRYILRPQFLQGCGGELLSNGHTDTLNRVINKRAKHKVALLRW